MSNELVSRQVTPSAAPVAMQDRTDALLVRAKMIANAPRDMLPKHYQGNPGACVLAVDWADRHDVSIFEALGEVSFVNGRPVVSARLQKRLAARYGYRTQVVASSVDEATVSVIGPDGVEVGRSTYTMAMAEALKIAKGPIWAADPAHMLVMRATTRALDYFGPAEFVIDSTDSVTPDPDESASEPSQQAADTDQVVSVPAEPVDAAQSTPGHTDWDDIKAKREIHDPRELAIPAPSEDELRGALKAKGIKVATAMRAAQDMHPDVSGTLGDIAGNADAAFDLAAWIDQQ